MKKWFVSSPLSPVFLFCIVAQSWSPAGLAQVSVDQLLDLDSVVERQVGRVQTRVMDRVQQQVTDRAAQSVDELAGQLVERRIPLERLEDQVLQSLIDVPERMQEGLPERLRILDRQGALAFVEVELEPNVRVVEYEWVMLVTAQQREQLRAEAPELMQYLVQTKPFNAIGGFLLRFLVPPDLDADAQALLARVPEDLRHLIDRNHIYALQSGSPNNTAGANTGSALPLPMEPVCSNPLAVGIIDSAVNWSHPAFQAVREGGSHKNFIAADLQQPQGHGTAIAGLLVGQGPELAPLLPNAVLYSASVIYAQNTRHQGTTAMQLLEALDWLLAQELAVINMSLTGPPNRLLEAGVDIAAAQGKVIVAAAGNEGPHAPPQYPAAYASVLAVTAVARDKSIYRWANQGEHIDFSALGVDVPTALGDGGFDYQSGTSLATPVVAAFIACAIAELLPELLEAYPPEQARLTAVSEARARLQGRAQDLGQPGRDPVFGYGLLHPVEHF